jgi:hypothetical protein
MSFRSVLDEINQCCESRIWDPVVFSSVVDPDPELFAGSGSGVGSGINHFGSRSGQSGSGMNFIPIFSVKSHIFSTKLHKKSEYLAHICMYT